MKRKLKRWTEEEHEQILTFFREPKTGTEKDNLAATLGRTWNSIYNKHWELKNPEKAQASKDRAKLVEKQRRLAKGKDEHEIIKVTHIAPKLTILKIGKCTIETYSTKIKIDDVLIEV